MADNVQITDNTAEVLSELERKKLIALTKIGITAEGFAKKNAPVNTGRLRNSITYVVNDDSVYIGTNIDYAPYVELGTGIYATDGKGRKSPWAYKDAKGKWHNTRGIKPTHFLKRAATNHSKEYQQIIIDTMKEEV